MKAPIKSLLVVLIALGCVYSTQPAFTEEPTLGELKRRIDWLEHQLRLVHARLPNIADTRTSCQCSDGQIVAIPKCPTPASLGAFELTRSELETLADAWAPGTNNIKALPYYGLGEIIGLRLITLEENSPFQKLGLCQGDIVVGSTILPSPASFEPPRLMEALRQTAKDHSIKTFSIDILRRKAELSLRISIITPQGENQAKNEPNKTLTGNETGGSKK